MLVEKGVSWAMVEQMSSLRIRPRVLCNRWVAQPNATSCLQPGRAHFLLLRVWAPGDLLFYCKLHIFVLDFQVQIKCRLAFHCEIWCTKCNRKMNKEFNLLHNEDQTAKNSSFLCTNRPILKDPILSKVTFLLMIFCLFGWKLREG